MTAGGWIIFAIIVVMVGVFGLLIGSGVNSIAGRILTAVICVAIVGGVFAGERWYFANTESGKRAIVDQRSDYGGGLERTITIYTADGNIIAQYQGKIDIESQQGGYIKFDFEGKRYIYYNCFVESIAEIGG